MTDNGNALAPVTGLPDKDEWGTIFGMAQQLVPTGFLPKAVDSPQKAAAIMLKGRELQIPPMYALSNITVIQGKPTANAELMLALVKRTYGRDVIWIEKSTPEVAKVGYMVHGKPKYYEFTIDMAKKAGLLSNQTWAKYPDAMLRARAISATCRMEFPEVIGGMYAPGELGEDVRVDETTGEVISVDYAPKATVEVEAPDPNKAMKRLHAVADKHGLTHDDLHRYAKSKSVGSLKAFRAETLNEIADGLEKNTDKALAYFAKLREKAELDQVNADVNALIDGKPADDGDATQGELVTAAAAPRDYGSE